MRLATTIACLNWWARHRAVRTENAAIFGERLKPPPTTLAVIKELASIRGHVLSRLIAAFWTSDCGVRDHAESILQLASDRYFWNARLIKA